MTYKVREKTKGQLNRRSLVLGLGGTLASVALFERAHGLESSDRVHNYDFRKESDFEDVIPYPNAHGGKGVIDVKYFFREDATQTTAAMPAWLLIFMMPPGSSEGVHTHNIGDKEAGSYDEFYYIIEGKGVMEIAGERIAVKAGDNVFTPNGVPHGIENTSPDKILKVYMIGVSRD
jgi:mannose-6-phosphate isomerase-like protein (cupin superfamily)